MSVELINPPGRPVTPFYHHVSVASGTRTIHVAGQTGSDEHAQLVPGGLAAQAERALRNVVLALEGAGFGAENLAALTIYVAGWRPELLEELGAGLAAAGDIPRVPATLIGVDALFEPDHLVEIQAVAVA
jgi:enamine deaminase RidA (YjgF/YER057c/UK114 family)